ncbi:pyridoxamine 5'-phosphate oxidase family protein [Streptomyces sp. NPDC050617]|uniref:pyridoxamine 5'-phosphate oxidase family protein n=1 Tax=Streptomyces sp. NPDC050617 TaxID=3154628 RepID=UPI003449F34D
MYETPEELTALQRLLDDSFAASGRYLRSVLREERRLDAAGVVDRLRGISTMALATVTASGEPRVAPVDAIFYRARFVFGTGPNSYRLRHIRARPSVSATVFDGERLQITAHGKATPLALAEEPGLEAFLTELYGKEAWDSWMRDIPWFRIDADKMITFRNPEGTR